MTRNKKIKQKLRNDGQAIANLQHAEHRDSSERAANGPKRKPRARKVIDLLGSREAQEAAWIASFSDVERFAARVPITQVTGAVPVDLYRVTSSGLGACSAGGHAFCAAEPDSWTDGTFAAAAGIGHLHANGAVAKFGGYTDSAYVAATWPAATADTVTAGVQLLGVPDISADFTSSGATGTEYISVGHRLSLSMVMPGGGADRFSGEVWAVTTLDPERAPISGASPDAIRSDSRKPGSLYRMSKYRITGSGLFVPVEMAVNGDDASALDMGGVGELSVHTVPLSVDAYKWRRCGDTVLQTKWGNATCGFYIFSTPNTSYRIRNTELWQTERYASSLVRAPSVGFPVGAALTTLQNLTQHAYGMLRPGVAGGLHTGVASTLANASQTPGFLSSLADGLSQGVNKIPGLLSTGSQLYQGLASAYKTGSNLLDAIHASGGANWAPGKPPPVGGFVSSVEEVAEGGSGVVELLEEGATLALEYGPAVLGAVEGLSVLGA